MDLGAESIQLLQLASHIEREFDVALDGDCMKRLTTVGGVADAVANARLSAGQC
jgi:acyl carrier protein